jgi:flagellar motor switch protein FliG
MSLDPAAAAELLKAAKPETLTEIAAEIVNLESGGDTVRREAAEPVREFVGMLAAPSDRSGNSFVRALLANAVGKQRSEEVIGKAQGLAEIRDPFRSLRGIDVVTLSQALEGQHPQVAAVVLMEITPDKCVQLIPLLEEAVRNDAMRRMAGGEPVLPEAKVRIAAILRDRIRELRTSPEKAPAAAGAAKGADTAHLRRIAILLRRLKKELRDSLVKAVSEKTPELGKAVQDMMIVWEDMSIIPDRPLQEVLRNVDARKLALALYKTDAGTDIKIRASISERARAMIDEELSLMKRPKAEDVEAARDAILHGLRQQNQAGALDFAEG